MTKTHQLLDLMASGKPVTEADIMEATGWTLAQLYGVVHFAKSTGYVNALSHAYVITTKGVARQQFKPATPAEKMQRSSAARRAKRLGMNQNLTTETMVQKSIRTNANSVFMLGKM